MTKVNSQKAMPVVCGGGVSAIGLAGAGAPAVCGGEGGVFRGTGGPALRGVVALNGRCEVLLGKARLFRELDAEVLRLLAAHATAHYCEPGELLFREGDEAKAYLLVESGDVEVFRYCHNGEERVFQVFEAGCMVAEAAMFMPHGRYPMCARSRSATRLYRLRRESLLAACRARPELAMHMLAALSHALYMQVNKVDWFTSSSASERLANYLLNLKPYDGNTVQLPLSQRQLASHLGVRAETLSRLLTDWQARGYVAGKRNAWELLDEAYLRKLASPAQRSF